MNRHKDVLDVVQRYLDGIYRGNAEDLHEVFHDNARVEDVVTGTFRSRSATEYIQAVASRQSPFSAGEKFAMAPMSIEVLGDIAVVTADLRFLGNHFFNVLSLLRNDGRWLITHKLFGAPGLSG
jgi:hypothetical protein